MVVGLDDLKSLHILHSEFPRTLPAFRRKANVCDNMDEVADEDDDQEKARGVLLYL